MIVRTLADLLREAQHIGQHAHVAVVAAHDPEVLLSIEQAAEYHIATATLIGDAEKIESIATENGLSLAHTQIIHQPDEQQAAQQAVSMAREGEAQVVVKGQIKTADLLRAALDRDSGIRTERLLSHVGIFEIPGFDRLIFMSDSGVVLYPTTKQKLTIIQSAVHVANRLGIEKPKVAILAASEEVHPSMPVSIEALALSRMAARGWITGAIVDGPLPLDAAISPEAARIKELESPVAGHADILIVPNVESGNIAAKAILYMGQGRMAGVVVGARVPIVINSRADHAETRLYSLAMAVLVGNQPNRKE